jgi:CheY-like chemotaxis protein
MKILVADDDRVHVHLVSSRLRAKGFDIMIAFDARQAWMAATRSPIDAIVLDIQMPGGTGLEVLRKLKPSTKTCLLPVMVLSGSIDAQAIEAVKALGADRLRAQAGGN